MKSLILIVAAFVTTGFAASGDATNLPAPTGVQADSGALVDRAFDSMTNEAKMQMLRSQDSAQMVAPIPDSIKARIQERRQEWAGRLTRYKSMTPEQVKRDLDSVKQAVDAKRKAEIAKLPEEVQAKVQARMSAVEAKHAQIAAKIEARRQEMKAKMEARKGTGGGTGTGTGTGTGSESQTPAKP